MSDAMDQLGGGFLILIAVGFVGAATMGECSFSRVIARYDCGGYRVAVHDTPRGHGLGFMRLQSGSRWHNFGHDAHPVSLRIRRGGPDAERLACETMAPPEGAK
jgi:hypothetical protein